ncbi:MAG: metallophosphoesterase [Chloroflexi bacterium]|nr:metallophosphoesterase [Chloroflexota bacterium]
MSHTNEIRIALGTDTHSWPGSRQSFGEEQEQLQPWFESIHATFLGDVRSVSPDILIHLGDFSCGGGTFEMPDALFHSTLERLNRDYRAAAPHFYGVPGNHDCPSGTDDYSFCEGLLGLAPRLGRTVDTDAARLVFLHSQGHSDEQRRAVLPKDPTHGWIADAELARLDRSLAEAGNRPVSVFTHQLLHPWANPQPWRTLYAVANSDAVLEIFARHGNVRAVFQGHAHILDVQEAMVGNQPVRFVVTPSLIQFPLGWLLLTLTPSSLRVQYRPLALPELSERSRSAGAGSHWRTPDPAWHDFTVQLNRKNS